MTRIAIPDGVHLVGRIIHGGVSAHSLDLGRWSRSHAAVNTECLRQRGVDHARITGRGLELHERHWHAVLPALVQKTIPITWAPWGLEAFLPEDA